MKSITSAENLIDSGVLDLVSARFADLVAQEHQGRMLEQVGRQLFEAKTEQEFAQHLLRSLGQRCSRDGLVYVSLLGQAMSTTVLGQSEFDASQRLSSEAQDLFSHQPGHLVEIPEPNFLVPGRGPGLEAVALCLRRAGVPMALILLSRRPSEWLVCQFLELLAERASQALIHLQQRQELELARQALRHGQAEWQKQSRLLNLMDDWSLLLSRLEGNYEELERLLETTVATLEGEKGSLMLLDERTSELVVRATCGLEPQLHESIRNGDHACRRLKLGEGVAGKVAHTLLPMVIHEVGQEPLFLEPNLSQVSSIVCLPLHVDGLLLGVINVTNKLSRKAFTQQHLEAGIKLAQHASLAINKARLYHLAIVEAETEVYSRHHLYQQAQDEMARSRRHQRPFSLMVVELTGMDTVCRHQGQPAVTRVEVHFAQILRRCVRETDVVARLGQYTLAVLMPETDPAGAMFAAERVEQLWRESETITRNLITPKIGLSSFPNRAKTVSALVFQAQAASRECDKSGLFGWAESA